jgi:hypothetical protein
MLQALEPRFDRLGSVKKLLGTSTLKLELAILDAYLPSNCVIAMLPAVRSVLGGTTAGSTCDPFARPRRLGRTEAGSSAPTANVFDPSAGSQLRLSD